MAVSANQLIERQAGRRQGAPVAASTRLYQGTLAFFNSAGHADDDTANGGNAFAGIVADSLDNSGGGNGALTAELWQRGVFELSGSGFAQTDVGRRAYASDNYTITTTALGNAYVGTIVEFVSSTRVRVRLDIRQRLEPTASVAAAGSAQGDAAALTGIVNSVSGADGTKGVVLPAAQAGLRVHAYNEHATAGLKVYPASGDDINDGTTDAAVTIEGKTLAEFIGLDSTTWAARYTADS